MHSLTPAIKQQVTDKIVACIATLKQKYGVDIPMPKISYDLRGTTAGMAYYRENLIKINPVLLVENLTDMLYETVPHELAHLATQKLYPEAHQRGWGTKRRPHGAEWQSIMRAMGVTPSRTHSYDVANTAIRKPGTITVKCSCCDKEYSMGAKRAARLQANPKSMWCRCSRNSQLIPVAAQSTPAPSATVTVSSVAKPTVAKPAVVKTAATGTKLEQCMTIFAANSSLSRGEVIKLFVSDAGCTTAGASTYYNTVKKLTA